VCLTDPIGPHQHVVLAFISSQPIAELLESDLSLAPEHPDFRATGLRVPSTLRLHRLLTASLAIAQRELGELSSALLTQVASRLRKLLAL
jgi:mRNA interferase MazF